MSEIENIGARRLQTMMEKLLEEVSFDRRGRGGTTRSWWMPPMSNSQLSEIVGDTDLSKYVL
jgi:ATP-dependent protease HslVU (ClpYQ) ATPase subunit